MKHSKKGDKKRTKKSGMLQKARTLFTGKTGKDAGVAKADSIENVGVGAAEVDITTLIKPADKDKVVTGQTKSAVVAEPKSFAATVSAVKTAAVKTTGSMPAKPKSAAKPAVLKPAATATNRSAVAKPAVTRPVKPKQAVTKPIITAKTAATVKSAAAKPTPAQKFTTAAKPAATPTVRYVSTIAAKQSANVAAKTPVRPIVQRAIATRNSAAMRAVKAAGNKGVIAAADNRPNISRPIMPTARPAMGGATMNMNRASRSGVSATTRQAVQGTRVPVSNASTSTPTSPASRAALMSAMLAKRSAASTTNVQTQAAQAIFAQSPMPVSRPVMPARPAVRPAMSGARVRSMDIGGARVGANVMNMPTRPVAQRAAQNAITNRRRNAIAAQQRPRPIATNARSAVRPAIRPIAAAPAMRRPARQIAAARRVRQIAQGNRPAVRPAVRSIAAAPAMRRPARQIAAARRVRQIAQGNRPAVRPAVRPLATAVAARTAGKIAAARGMRQGTNIPGVKPRITTCTEDSVFLQRLYLFDMSMRRLPVKQQFLRGNVKPVPIIKLDCAHTKIGENLYEVILRVTTALKVNGTPVFMVKVSQAGVFRIEGCVENDEQLTHLLGRYCPSILYPHARAVIADLVNRGGYPAAINGINAFSFDTACKMSLSDKIRLDALRSTIGIKNARAGRTRTR